MYVFICLKQLCTGVHKTYSMHNIVGYRVHLIQEIEIIRVHMWMHMLLLH